VIKSYNKSKFFKIAKECKTDSQKVNFFNTNREAFFPNEYDFNLSKEHPPKEIDDAFYVYANMKRMTEDELEKFKMLTWENYPTNFKIFLFDFCFLNAN
tara:strand:+ start:342 stop:638 length:297 start_codon:yes stop_codon:yes gene_type:complete